VSLTAIVVILVYVLGLGLAFFYRPIFGLLSYLWIFYNDPATHWWGAQLPDVRYSLIAAFVALMAALLRTPRPAQPWIGSPAAKIFVMYAVWTWIQTLWAVGGDIHVEGAILFSKYLVLSYVLYRLLYDERNMELFMWAHVVGCFLFGWEGYTSGVSGRLETVGGPGVDDANLLAAHMITGLVVAGFMFVGFSGIRRWAALALIPFILNGIVLTQSRGGFVALIAAGIAAWYFSARQYRKMVSLAAALAVGLLLLLGDQAFWERIQTIADRDQRSEETRLQIIGPQFQMFLDHPLGAGHRGAELLSPQYLDPEQLDGQVGRRAAHNTFMAALVDQGWPGALMLISLYVWGLSTLRELRKLESKGMSSSLALYIGALGGALGSLLFSGLFLNLLKTEVQVWLATFLMAMVAQARISSARSQTAEAASIVGIKAVPRSG
jgi:O-antigen ligase